MGRKSKSYEDLMQLARDYGVEENPIVEELASKYAAQKRILDQIAKTLAKEGLTTAKEYVKGRENLCSHPLLDAWPKNNDSARNTLDALGDAIIKFGTQPKKKTGKLAELMADG